MYVAIGHGQKRTGFVKLNLGGYAGLAVSWASIGTANMLSVSRKFVRTNLKGELFILPLKE